MALGWSRPAGRMFISASLAAVVKFVIPATLWPEKKGSRTKPVLVAASPVTGSICPAVTGRVVAGKSLGALLVRKDTKTFREKVASARISCRTAGKRAVRIGEVRILRIYLRKTRKVSADSVGAGGKAVDICLIPAYMSSL